MRRAALAWALSALLLGAGPANANPWAFIDPLLAQTLGIGEGNLGTYLFPDHADPGVASVALAFHYSEGGGGGNSFGITVGLYQRTGDNWGYVGPVDGIFGVEPRDAAFFPERIEVSTSTLGPNDPRCCPSAVTRWSVDRVAGVVTRLP